jgi:hypothetical protein
MPSSQGATVGLRKALISLAIHQPSHHMQLVFNGQLLVSDSQPIVDIGITHESIIVLQITASDTTGIAVTASRASYLRVPAACIVQGKESTKHSQMEVCRTEQACIGYSMPKLILGSGNSGSNHRLSKLFQTSLFKTSNSNQKMTYIHYPISLHSRIQAVIVRHEQLLAEAQCADASLSTRPAPRWISNPETERATFTRRL